MTQVLIHDPTNRKQWDENTRYFLALWWVWGAICLLFMAIAIDRLSLMPQRYVEKRQQDAFVANSVVVRATITGCARLWRDPAHVTFEFVPAGHTTTEGLAIYDGTCASYEIGEPLTIRYSPANPSQSQGIGQIDHANDLFYQTLRMIVGAVLVVVLTGHGFITGLFLSAKGRVRIGRILSTKPLHKHARFVRYQVAANDGTVVKGWRVMPYDNIIPALAAGAPIPILYANRHIHWPFGLSIRR